MIVTIEGSCIKHTKFCKHKLFALTKQQETSRRNTRKNQHVVEGSKKARNGTLKPAMSAAEQIAYHLNTVASIIQQTLREK